jgi:hypothetical protein
MNDGFSIGTCSEVMAAREQVIAKLGEIVNLAIEHHPDAAVLIGKRLMTAGEIDDAEAPKTKTQTAVNENAFVIGTAMDDGVGHAANERLGDRVAPLKLKNSADSAHSRGPVAGDLRF